VPLTINCWPSVSGGDSYVNIEYEAHAGFDLQNVVISTPCHTAPRVNEARRPSRGPAAPPPGSPAGPAAARGWAGRARACVQRSAAGLVALVARQAATAAPAQGRAVGPAPHSRGHIAVMSPLRTTCRG